MIPVIDLYPLWRDMGKDATVDGVKIRVIDMKGQNPDPIFSREMSSFGEQVDHYIMVLPPDVRLFKETSKVTIGKKTFYTHPPSTNAVGVGFVSLTDYRSAD